MPTTLTKATKADTPLIVELLSAMQDELEELVFDTDTSTHAVSVSFDEGVNWFLFYDENGDAFGTCYLQPVHNYWSRKKRYYLGGFYIKPTHRGKGRFKDIYAQLKNWATAHDGTQIYAHIHHENDKSIATFKSVGLEEVEYRLFVDQWDEA